MSTIHTPFIVIAVQHQLGLVLLQYVLGCSAVTIAPVAFLYTSDISIVYTMQSVVTQ